jgi:dethiobiotin synthetase
MRLAGATRGFFITGVGTGVGKTLVTTILCHQLTRMGQAVSALKPLVSGFVPDDPASHPALILRSLGRSPTPEAIAAIAPWRFAAPLSPHLAAHREGRSTARDDLAAFCRAREAEDRDFLLVEGAGGVMSPIEPETTCLDLILRLGYPAILVTGTYLGALSHTLTALAVLQGRGAAVRGIVVSESRESAGLAETAETLQHFAGVDLPMYALPRLADGPEEKWRIAPSLTGLCEPIDV